MPGSRLERWYNEADDAEIGIRYRVVRLAQGHRVTLAADLRSVRQARQAAAKQLGEFLIVVVAHCADAPEPGEARTVPVELTEGETGLRVLIGDDPVDFIVEEDTCDGETTYNEPGDYG